VVFAPAALVAGLDDFAITGQAIEERGCYLGVAKHLGQSPKADLVVMIAQVALVRPTDQMEEQLAAGPSEGRVAEFVENDEVDAREIAASPNAAGAGLALQPVDEVDDGVEAAWRRCGCSPAQWRHARRCRFRRSHGVALLGEPPPPIAVQELRRRR
jgi:hypothetical protein